MITQSDNNILDNIIKVIYKIWITHNSYIFYDKGIPAMDIA